MTVFRLLTLHNHASSSNEETGDNDTVTFLHVYSRQNSSIFKYYGLSVPLCLIRSFSRASLPLARVQHGALAQELTTSATSWNEEHKNDKISPLTVQENLNVLDRNWTQPERLVRRVVVTGERERVAEEELTRADRHSARAASGQVTLWFTRLDLTFLVIFLVILLWLCCRFTCDPGPSYGSIFLLIFYWKLNLRVQ